MVLGMARRVELRADHPAMELVADLRRERRFDRIALDGLSEAEADALVAARLGAAPSAAFVRGLREQTDGNPFFIEEALRALVEAEVLAARRAGARPARWSRSACPTASPTSSCAGSRRVSELARRGADDRRRRSAASSTSRVVAGAARPPRRARHRGARGGDRRRARRRGRRLRRPLRVQPRARPRRDLRAPVAHAPRAAAPARRDRARGARRERRRARPPVLRRARGRRAPSRPCATRCWPATRRRARSPTRTRPSTTAARWRRSPPTPAADESRRCDILLALGPRAVAGRRRARRARRTTRRPRARASAATPCSSAAPRSGSASATGRATPPTRSFAPLIADAVRIAAAARTAGCARGSWAAWPRSSTSPPRRATASTLSADALAMARRLGDPETLVMTLMSRHVTLLHIEHLDERIALSRGGARAAAASTARCAPRRCTGACYDVFELGSPEEARRDHAELTALGAELRQPLLEHLAVGWQGVFAQLAGDVEAAERFAVRSLRARPPRAGRLRQHATCRGCSSRCAASRAASTSCCRRWRRSSPAARRTTRGSPRSRSPRSRPAPSRRAASTTRRSSPTARAPCRATGTGSSPSSCSPRPCCALRDRERAQQLYDLLAPFADRYVQVIFAANWGSVQRHARDARRACSSASTSPSATSAPALEANERIGAVLMTAETQCEYGALLRARGGAGRPRAGGGARRRSSSGSPAPRGLDGLRRRAGGDRAGGRRVMLQRRCIRARAARSDRA